MKYNSSFNCGIVYNDRKVGKKAIFSVNEKTKCLADIISKMAP